MEPDYFGTEQFTDEDRAYKGSRFSEVRDALFANPYQRVWGGEGEPPLPVYEVNLRGTLRGILPFGRRRTFKNWRHIGKLTFDNAVISYNGDFVIHFNHPTWRDDRNDPSTATRVSGCKVR